MRRTDERLSATKCLASRAVCAGLLVARDAQNLAIGERVQSAGSNSSLVMRFPTAGSVVIAARFPVQLFVAAIIAVIAAESTAAFASSAGSAPSGVDDAGGECHLHQSLLRWKLTMRSENGMMNLLERAPGKPPVLPKAVGSASCRRFLSAPYYNRRKMEKQQMICRSYCIISTYKMLDKIDFF